MHRLLELVGAHGIQFLARRPGAPLTIAAPGGTGGAPEFDDKSPRCRARDDAERTVDHGVGHGDVHSARLGLLTARLTEGHVPTEDLVRPTWWTTSEQYRTHVRFVGVGCQGTPALQSEVRAPGRRASRPATYCPSAVTSCPFATACSTTRRPNAAGCSQHGQPHDRHPTDR